MGFVYIVSHLKKMSEQIRCNKAQWANQCERLCSSMGMAAKPTWNDISWLVLREDVL